MIGRFIYFGVSGILTGARREEELDTGTIGSGND
jgi:hypothetical protein